MKTRARLSAAAAALGFAVMPAQADIAGSVRLENFGYRLIDLNPNDGIAPALTFNDAAFSTGLSAYTSEGRAPDGDHLLYDMAPTVRSWQAPFQRFAQGSRSVSAPNGWASATLSGSVADRSYTAVVQGGARGTLADPEFAATFGADINLYGASALGLPAMTLTPYTAVVWSGDVAMHAQSTLRIRDGRFEQAATLVEMELRDARTNQLYGEFRDWTQTTRYHPGEASKSASLELTWENASADMSTARFRSLITAQGWSFLPVPEPGAPWLLLCGAALLAGVVRRRGGPRRNAAMTTRRRTAPALAAVSLTLLAATPAARAALSADARITGLGYRLVDLRPGDGIAPGITFAALPAGYGGGSAINSYFNYVDRRLDPEGYGLSGGERAIDSLRPFAPLSTLLEAPGLSTGGTMGGSVARHSFQFAASGRFDPGDAAGSNWVGTELLTTTQAAALGMRSGASAFRLTPFTAVVWTGQASIRLRSTSDLGAGAQHTTQGVVSFEVRDTAGGLLEGFSHGETLETRGRGARRYADDFSLRFANNGAGSSVALLSAYNAVFMRVEAPTAGLAAPVPEPGTWALMLCGLGAVGAAARWRRPRGGSAGAAAG